MNISELPYNITKLCECKNNKELVEYFPDFNHPIYLNELPIAKGKAIALIVLLYSKNGMLLEYKDTLTAKIKAAEQLGYVILNRKIVNEDVNKLLFGGSISFTSMIVEYLRHQHSLEHAEICIYLESYFTQLEKLGNGDTDLEKTKDLLLNIETIKVRVNKLLLEYSNGDSSKSLKQGILEGIEDDRLELTPEAIAEKIRDKTLSFKVAPYGKGYNFKKYGNRAKINPYNNE